MSRPLIWGSLPSLLLLLAGCSTPPLRVVPVATIRNYATLSYAFGEGGPFRVQSVPVDVTALVPRASGDSSLEAAAIASTDAAARIESRPAASSSGAADAGASAGYRTNQSAIVVEQAQSAVRLADASAFRAAAQSASSFTEAEAQEQHDVSIANASRVDTAAASTIGQQFRKSSGETLVQGATTATEDFAGSGKSASHHSAITQQLARAEYASSTADATSAWITRQPTITKWATRERVVVSDEFEYIVEIRNTTPMDLAFAEVEDLLDWRLSVKPSAVRTIPYGKAGVDLRDRLLTVRFPRGIGRGQRVRIIIPTTLKTNIAEPSTPLVRETHSVSRAGEP